MEARERLEYGRDWVLLKGSSRRKPQWKREEMQWRQAVQAKKHLGIFVNAAGWKQNPVIIGHAVQPRCFKHLNDRKRPYGCYYVSNKKAWMINDVMDNILSSLNQRLQQRQRNISLFLDNAPCHSTNLEGTFSIITLIFLPKKNTSKTVTWQRNYRKLEM